MKITSHFLLLINPKMKMKMVPRPLMTQTTLAPVLQVTRTKKQMRNSTLMYLLQEAMYPIQISRALIRAKATPNSLA